MGNWRFLTNHALVLIHVSNNPRTTLREIAGAVGITERAGLSILRALEGDGLISRQREGRKMRYWVDFHALLNDKLVGPYTVNELARVLMELANRLNDDNPGAGPVPR